MLTRFWEADSTDQELFGQILLDRESILERVDEYSLYAFYLSQAYGVADFAPIINHARYRSPIRPDDKDPSFGVFESRKSKDTTYLWKDQALGITGNIFHLVKLLYNYDSMDEANLRIAKDFQLADVTVSSGTKIILAEPPEKVPIDIKITSRPFTQRELDYWAKINIDPALLKRYNVTAAKYVWLYGGGGPPSIAEREFTFAYRIWNLYKIYRPLGPKKDKFRNNYDERCIEGLLQLEFNQQLLIITKATKDVIFLRSLGYEAVAPRGESTPIEEPYLSRLKSKYLNVVTLFDNDGKHKAKEFYPGCPELHVPIETGEKDPTDYCTKYGTEAAAQLVYSLIESYL